MRRGTRAPSSGWRPGIAITTLLCGGLFAPACASAVEEPVTPAMAHAIHSEKLARVMLQLQRIEASLQPQELEAEAETRRLQGEVVEMAGALVRSADAIPEVLEEVSLQPEQRAEFLLLTQAFKEAAQRLEWQAPSLSSLELQAEVEGLRDTCTACHTRFRVLPAVD